ncbi:hypothetical protein ACHAW5_001488 [Stephanodiscus triporus]|uniref:Uncharacterized protein n=1 Tax=Stephanodiscus triporus TaxID=2934178 RepID=A0ABD3Q408_9STRA
MTTDNAELRGLISAKRWPAVVERVRSHPHEVGSSSRLRDERGYTALHAVAAYNRGSDWRELVPSNRASWSPLHLVCVQGGIARGKVPLMKALLQMDEDHRGGVSPLQHRILALLDRQERNILHHLLDSKVPSDDAFDAIRFAVAMTPSLLFQRDSRGKTPLDYVLPRLLESPGTSRRHYMMYRNDDPRRGMQRNYSMLKMLVEYMDRDARGWGGVQPKNVLQSACLLPQNSCPSDGSLLTYLCSCDASNLELETRDGDDFHVNNFASEVDEQGNHALHLFLSNKSYAHGGIAETAAGDGNDAMQCTLENKIMTALLDGYHEAISIPNSSGELPLRIAMKAGRRRTLPTLLQKYSDAVLFDESMLNIKFYVHVLACISVTPDFLLLNDEVDNSADGGDSDDAVKRLEIQNRWITIMYNLVRARPDIISLASRGIREVREDVLLEGKKKKKKKWWSNINIFS